MEKLKHPLSPDREHELERCLRSLGSEVLVEKIPKRLLDVLGAATEPATAAQEQDAEGAHGPDSVKGRSGPDRPD